MEQTQEFDHDSLPSSLSQTPATSTSTSTSTVTSDSEFSDPALVEPNPIFHEDEYVTETLDSVSDEAEVLRCGGLRLVGIDSDSDSDYVESEGNQNPNPNPNSPVPESQRIDEFDWEEVGDRVDDVAEAEFSISSDNFTDEGDYEEDEDPSFRNLEWEFLLAVNNMHRSLILDSDPYVSAHEDFVHAIEMDDNLFDQFVENEMGIKGSPPAAKTVVENLPFEALSEDCVCPVCKDEMVVGDPVRKLPCLHCYHGDCILPWLGMRNSCPVCRYELPTDDLEYERSKSSDGRDGGGVAEWDSRVSWDFELFA